MSADKRFKYENGEILSILAVLFLTASLIGVTYVTNKGPQLINSFAKVQKDIQDIGSGRARHSAKVAEEDAREMAASQVTRTSQSGVQEGAGAVTENPTEPIIEVNSVKEKTDDGFITHTTTITRDPTTNNITDADTVSTTKEVNTIKEKDDDGFISHTTTITRDVNTGAVVDAQTTNTTSETVNQFLETDQGTVRIDTTTTTDLDTGNTYTYTSPSTLVTPAQPTSQDSSNNPAAVAYAAAIALGIDPTDLSQSFQNIVTTQNNYRSQNPDANFLQTALNPSSLISSLDVVKSLAPALTQSNPALTADTPLIGYNRVLTSTQQALAGTLYPELGGQALLTSASTITGFNDVINSSNRLFYQTGMTPEETQYYNTHILARAGDAIMVGATAVGVGDIAASSAVIGVGKTVTQGTLGQQGLSELVTKILGTIRPPLNSSYTYTDYEMIRPSVPGGTPTKQYITETYNPYQSMLDQASDLVTSGKSPELAVAEVLGDRNMVMTDNIKQRTLSQSFNYGIQFEESVAGKVYCGSGNCLQQSILAQNLIKDLGGGPVKTIYGLGGSPPFIHTATLTEQGVIAPGAGEIVSQAVFERAARMYHWGNFGILNPLTP